MGPLAVVSDTKQAFQQQQELSKPTCPNPLPQFMFTSPDGPGMCPTMCSPHPFGYVNMPPCTGQCAGFCLGPNSPGPNPNPNHQCFSYWEDDDDDDNDDGNNMSRYDRRLSRSVPSLFVPQPQVRPLPRIPQQQKYHTSRNPYSAREREPFQGYPAGDDGKPRGFPPQQDSRGPEGRDCGDYEYRRKKGTRHASNLQNPERPRSSDDALKYCRNSSLQIVLNETALTPRDFDEDGMLKQHVDFYKHATDAFRHVTDSYLQAANPSSLPVIRNNNLDETMLAPPKRHDTMVEPGYTPMGYSSRSCAQKKVNKPPAPPPRHTCTPDQSCCRVYENLPPARKTIGRP